MILAFTFRISDTISHPVIGTPCPGTVLIEYYLFLNAWLYASPVQAEPGLSSFC